MDGDALQQAFKMSMFANLCCFTIVGEYFLFMREVYLLFSPFCYQTFLLQSVWRPTSASGKNMEFPEKMMTKKQYIFLMLSLKQWMNVGMISIAQ